MTLQDQMSALKTRIIRAVRVTLRWFIIVSVIAVIAFVGVPNLFRYALAAKAAKPSLDGLYFSLGYIASAVFVFVIDTVIASARSNE